MRVSEAWVQARDLLGRSGIVDQGIEAEVLLRHTMRLDRAEFFAALDDQLDPDRQEVLASLLQRRAEREPLAYIVGHREFYGLDFQVDSRVMIPRQETELLVDQVLEFARVRRRQSLLVADVGTGSGAIAIAIAHHLPSATVFAMDSSREALQVADANRRRHSVSERVHLLDGDLLQPLPAPVDVIVSNLPYIMAQEVPDLAPEVGREPLSALDGGPEGLDLIAGLLRQAPSTVRPGGMVLTEIGPDQIGRVLDAGRRAFPEAEVSQLRDLLGLPRVVRILLRTGPEAEAPRPSAAVASRI